MTQILSQIERGDPGAAEQPLPLMYDVLRKLAAVRLAQEKPGQLVGFADQAGLDFDVEGDAVAAGAEVRLANFAGITAVET